MDSGGLVETSPMTKSSLEQAYLAIDKAISDLNRLEFITWLTLDHKTILVDGGTCDYAFYADPEKWKGFHSAFAAQFPDQIQLGDQQAVVFSRTFGIHDKGRRIEIRGRCRDEWIWDREMWKIRRRYKLEQNYYEGDTLLLHRELSAVPPELKEPAERWVQPGVLQPLAQS